MSDEPQPALNDFTEADGQEPSLPNTEQAVTSPIAEWVAETSGVPVATEAAAVEPSAPEPDAVADTPDAPEPDAVADTPDAPEPDAAADAPSALQAPAEQIVPPATPDESVPAGAAAPAWPFFGYAGLWVAYAALLTWRLLETSADVASYEAEVYPALLLGGVALTAAGPLLIAVVFLARMGRAADKGQLFISTLYRGAVATTAGVALWWAALLVVDQIRLGHLL